tara:strand:- start:714 stop:1265 length:552 start_codon:yes stop_codon:yes gene_type:complete
LTKNLITINQFIKKSLGEWKSIRSTHSLAFQEVENSTSKIFIKDIEINDIKVIELLKKYNLNTKSYLIPISISWESSSDWDENQKFEEDQTILLFLPKEKNSGIVLRNKGYSESVISSSEYYIDESSNLNLKTFYKSTFSEERICFLSPHIRSRYSVTRNKADYSVMQTSHTSEIRNMSTLKD